MSWDDIAAKLDRASQLVQSFQTEAETYLNGDANGVLNDFESEPGYFLVKAFSKSPPPRIYSILIGELLYHMRSTLDHVACQLTRDNGEECSEKVEFPIWTRPTGFGALGDPAAWNSSRIGAMNITKQKIIEEEQPFHGRHGTIADDPLTWLYVLSNIDRHRFLHLGTASTRVGYVGMDTEEAKSRFVHIRTSHGPVEGEVVVAGFGIREGAEIQVKVETNVKFDIAFTDGPLAGRYVSNTLGSIGVRVSELIGRLK